jgi:hypothetical protein
MKKDELFCRISCKAKSAVYLLIAKEDYVGRGGMNCSKPISLPDLHFNA